MDVRKLISLLLILVLAINWLGFDLVVTIMNHTITASTQRHINEGKYDRNDLIEIKVAVDLPYTTDWSEFQQANGSFVLNGIAYNFVEQKFEKGFMIYHCLPNEKGTALTQAEKQFFADAHDIEKPDGQQKQNNKKSSAKKWTLETGVSIDQDEKDAIAFAASLPNLQLTIAAKDGFGFLPAQPPETRMNS